MAVNNLAYAWGLNDVGQLGNNTTTDRSSPVAVVGNHSFTMVAAGQKANAGLKSDGSVWTWGNADSGGLGDNTTTNKSSPVAVVGAHSFIAVVAGGKDFDETCNMLALKANGQAWAWGVNSAAGALGDGTTSNRSSPVLIVGNHAFIQVVISQGSNSGQLNLFSGGLKADGSAWMWGRNASGELGDNTTTSRSSPVAVVGSHSFMQLTVTGGAGECSAGLKSDGSVWTWGAGSSGQLGDNTATAKSSPVAVVGNHSFIQISGGNKRLHGLKADGSVWSWGDNTLGALGDNSATARSSPVAVVESHSFIAIAGGGVDAMALKANGQIWAWGSNANGRLGDNTTTSRSSPVLVVGNFNFGALAADTSDSLAVLATPAPGRGGMAVATGMAGRPMYAHRHRGTPRG